MKAQQPQIQRLMTFTAGFLLASIALSSQCIAATHATSFSSSQESLPLAFVGASSTALPLQNRIGNNLGIRSGATSLQCGLHRDDQVTCKKSALRVPATSRLAWQDYRARLIQAETPYYMRRASQHSGVWVHEISELEKGCILIEVPKTKTSSSSSSSSSSSREQGRRVIFLVEHDKQHGSYGLVLNQPTPCSIGDFTERLPHFADKIIHFGGEGHRSFDGKGPNRELHTLHPYPHVSGAEQVRDGVCVGADLHHASSLAGKRTVDPGAFKFFYSASCWTAGKLEKEVEQGQWVAASCSKEIILKEPKYWEKPLWQVVLEVMGGKHGLICRELCDGL